MAPRRPLLACCAAVLAALVPAASAEAARHVPAGFYGVNWDREVRSAPAEAREGNWSLMATSGAESVRAVFSWQEGKPRRDGPFDFTDTDPIVAGAAAHGQDVLAVVMNTPRWARRVKRDEASAPK